MSDTPKGNSRPAFIRILLIADAIRERRQGITAFDLATRFGVQHKTIMRDLDFLRYIGAPIYFNHALHTWIWNVCLDIPWWFGGPLRNLEFRDGKLFKTRA